MGGPGAGGNAGNGNQWNGNSNGQGNGNDNQGNGNDQGNGNNNGQGQSNGNGKSNSVKVNVTIQNVGASITGFLDGVSSSAGTIQGTLAGAFSVPDANGHGVAVFVSPAETVAYDYVIVSPTHLLLIEADGGGSIVGEADQQTKTFSQTDLNGPYAFSMSGLDGSFGSKAAIAGQFTSDGVRSVSGDVSENIRGTLFIGTAFAGSFTMGNGSFNGRGELSLNLLDNPGGDTFVFYMVSPAQAFVLQIDSSQDTSGIILAQTGGPFTASSLVGNYGLQFSGLEGQFEIDASGYFSANGKSLLNSGALDINNENLASPPFVYSDNLITAGAFTLDSQAYGRGTMSFNSAGAPFRFTFYFVSPRQVFCLETDQTFLSAGRGFMQ